MQKVMQNCAAVYRTGDSLKEGVQLIDQCAAKMPHVKVRRAERRSRSSARETALSKTDVMILHLLHAP
jgi:succinate dehydrogenase/fumarate reductase flavoprotein subunit